MASDPTSSVEHIFALISEEVAVGRWKQGWTVHRLTFSSTQSKSFFATALVPGIQGQDEEANLNKAFDLQTDLSKGQLSYSPGMQDMNLEWLPGGDTWCSPGHGRQDLRSPGEAAGLNVPAGHSTVCFHYIS